MSSDSPDRTLAFGDAGRVDALREEFERAWTQGAAPRIEDYLDRLDDWLRFAAFGELLKSEISLRRERREPATVEEYLARFPDYAVVVREVCAPAEVAATIASPEAPAPGKPRSGLHVRCPHCHNPIELVPEAELESIRCGSCGSQFSLTSDKDEATRDARNFAQVGHFKLVERLGMGAFGTVWKAQDIELDRTVAIKIPRAGQLDKQRQELFLREARSAAQLRHPNIVPVYEVGRDGDTLYIVSELVRGIALSDRLTAGPVTAREAAELCAKIAAALHHAHEQGVIHRDLKPANVMLDEEGEPHLMDFGLARREANEITMTIDGQILGTPAYMSPEQALGEAHVADRRSDVYSLGVILFELLTGELPFRGNTRMMIHQVIHDEPPNPRKLNSSIPRDLETITLKCMQKEPHRRYQGANEAALELGRYQRGEPIAARPVGIVMRQVRWCKRNPLVASLVASTIALLATVAIVATVGSIRSQRAAATSNAVSSFLEKLFRTTNPLVASDEYGISVAFQNPTDVNRSIRDVLDQGAKQITQDLAEEPQVRARLLASMGNANYGLGEFRTASNLFQQALDIERLHGSDDPLAIANSMHRLAMALYYAPDSRDQDYKESEELLRDALIIMNSAGDQGCMPATAVKQSLAMVLVAKEEFDAAEAMLREVIASREELRGLYDESVLHGLEALVGMQLLSDQVEEAEKTIVRLLRRASHKGDVNFQQAAEILRTFAKSLHARDSDEHEEAASLLKQTIDDVVKLLGDRHPFVSLIEYDYGMALNRIGEHDEAVRVLERAVSSANSLVNPGHPMQLSGRRNLAEAYVSAGDFEQADRILKEMDADVKKEWGANSWAYAHHLATWAILRFKEGNLDDGKELTARALQIVGGPGRIEHRRGIYTIILWYKLSDILIGIGELRDAERAIAFAQAAAQDTPIFHPWIARFDLLRAKILTIEKRYAAAVSLLRSTHGSLQEQLGLEHRVTRAAEVDLREAERLAESAIPVPAP